MGTYDSPGLPSLFAFLANITMAVRVRTEIADQGPTQVQGFAAVSHESGPRFREDCGEAI